MNDTIEKLQILKERAAALAVPVQLAEDEGQCIHALGFLLSDEKYYIDETFVVEVLPLMELTPLPCTPSFILGIINVRGRILSVINLKEFLNLPAKGITNLNRVIVVKKNEIEIGLLVDEISMNIEIELDKIQREYIATSAVQKKFLIGVTADQSVVFDIDKFLSDDEIIINENS